MTDTAAHNKKLGMRVRNIRRHLGYSGDEFARALGTSKQAVSLIETGRRAPSAAFLSEIVRRYGIDARYILGQIDEIPPDSGAGGQSESPVHAASPVDRIAISIDEIALELQRIRTVIERMRQHQEHQ